MLRWWKKQAATSPKRERRRLKREMEKYLADIQRDPYLSDEQKQYAINDALSRYRIKLHEAQ